MIKKIFNYLDYKFLNYIKTKDRKNFANWFNFYTSLFRNKSKISFYNDYFYLNNDTKKWKFYHKFQGLIAYRDGLNERKDNLRNEYLIDKLNFKDNDVVIDVGANNGDFYLCFENKIKYFGFEPSPVVFSSLKYNIKNQNLYNKGIWKESSKKLDFYLSDEFGNSSIIPINKFTKKISIDTVKLDEIIDNIKSDIKLIKIEAEGAEPEVLQGLKKNLNKVEYITIDCGFERNNNSKSTVGDCSNYLLENNFKIINFGQPRVVLLFKNKLK